MPSYDPIHLTFNQKPHAIVQGMDDLLKQRHQAQATHQRRSKLPLILFLVGSPFICLDLLITFGMGYRLCVFSSITLTCWLAAIVIWLIHRRSRILEIPPLYPVAREILYTLRDDANPKRGFFGHLDLTGTRQASKVAREASDSLGRTTQLFRDEWFSLKANLYDGNMLRLSLVKRDKVRKGYWKRSAMSGKMKWKGPKEKGNLQEIKMRLSVNPEVYHLPTAPVIYPGASISGYRIEESDVNSGVISLSGSSLTDPISATDVLTLLKSVYSALQRKV